MTALDLINHLRQCSLAEVRLQLERLSKRNEAEYLVVERFILRCQPTYGTTDKDSSPSPRR